MEEEEKFEEEFPSLKNRMRFDVMNVGLIHKTDVFNYCLDKAKVKEAIKTMKFYNYKWDFTNNPDKTKEELIKELKL